MIVFNAIFGRGKGEDRGQAAARGGKKMVGEMLRRGERERERKMRKRENARKMRKRENERKMRDRDKRQDKTYFRPH